MPTKETEEITRQIDRLTFSEDRGEPAEAAASEAVRFRHVVVGIDGSEGARKAVEWAAFVAGLHEATLTIALVLPPMHPITGRTLTAANPASAKLWKELAGEQERMAKRALKEAEKLAAEAGVKASTLLERGPVTQTIVDLVEREGGDLVVVGSHGRTGMKRFLLGSVAESVKNRAPVSVLIARNRPPQKKVLLAVDGSDQSRRAAQVLTGVMEEGATWAHVVHVVHAPVEGLSEDLQDRWRQATEDMRRPLVERVELPRGSWVHYDILFGEPADEIVEAALEDEAGLVVMGCRGLSGVKALFAGSVSGRVARHVSSSVLLVK